MKSGNLYGSRTKNTGVLFPIEVPIPLVGVELQREAADIPLRVGRPALAGHCGKAQETVGLLPDGGEERRLGESRDVIGDSQRAERSGSLCVDHALGNAFAVEVAVLFE